MKHKKSAEIATEVDRYVAQARAEINALAEDAFGRMPKRLPKPRARTSGHMVKLMVPDLHLGKLAWAEETMHQNYDIKEASRLYREAIATLIDRTAHEKPERIVLVYGNDYLHSDTKTGTTTKGTPLDNDSRFAKMFREGRMLMTDVITELHEHAPVTVISCPGNHASVAEWALAESLACWFRNTSTIDILNAPTPRKYYEWGQCLLGFEHGNMGKLEDLPLLMATEMPEAFGRTRYRHWFTGDKHQKMVFERMGVRVSISPALCPPDAWHSESHYVNNLRQAEAYVWSKTEGLVAQAFYTA